MMNHPTPMTEAAQTYRPNSEDTESLLKSPEFDDEAEQALLHGDGDSVQTKGDGKNHCRRSQASYAYLVVSFMNIMLFIVSVVMMLHALRTKSLTTQDYWKATSHFCE
jgi:hypothetical protein